MTHKTLNDRVLEAKALARESKVVKRDRQGRASVVIVPGSKATLNQVILRRYKGGIISAECSKLLGNYGNKPCLGNKSGVCRHSIAALMVAFSDTGYIPRFRKNLDNATAFALRNSDLVMSDRLGEPIVFNLKSWKRTNRLYFVAEDVVAKDFSRS